MRLKNYGGFKKAVYSTSFIINLKTKQKREKRRKKKLGKEVNIASVDHEIGVNRFSLDWALDWTPL